MKTQTQAQKHKPYNYIVVDNVGACRCFYDFTSANSFAIGLSTGRSRDVIVSLISYVSGIITHYITDDSGNSCYHSCTVPFKNED